MQDHYKLTENCTQQQALKGLAAARRLASKANTNCSSFVVLAQSGVWKHLTLFLFSAFAASFYLKQQKGLESSLQMRVVPFYAAFSSYCLLFCFLEDESSSSVISQNTYWITPLTFKLQKTFWKSSLIKDLLVRKETKANSICWFCVGSFPDWLGMSFIFP